MPKSTKKLAITSKVPNSQGDLLMEKLKSLNSNDLEAKFNNMLDEMNIQNQELRESLCSKDNASKLQMLHQFLKSSETLNMQNRGKGPPQTPQEFSAELSKTDLSPQYLLSVLQILRVNLSTNPLTWIHDFSETSTKKIKNIMINYLPSIQRNESTGQKILDECVKCMKSIMDSQAGLNTVMSDHEHIDALACCIHPENSQLMGNTVRLLAAMSLVKYSLTLQCVSRVARRNNHSRFKKIIEGLQPHQPVNLRLNCLLFINAIITGAEDYKLRIYLRFELNRAGLPNAIPHLKSLENPNIDVQLYVYEESRDDDIAEMQNLLHLIETNFETADDCFKVLLQAVKDTPSEYYITSILHLLLTVDGDIIRRKCYFQLAEELLTQLFLQKNGLDYDFTVKPMEVNFEPILEGMAQKTLLDEVNSRLETVEQKYSEAVTTKSEVEAKLSITIKNSESKIKVAEEKSENLAKTVAENEILINKLNSQISQMQSQKNIGNIQLSDQTNVSPPPPPPGFDDTVPPPPPGFDDAVPPPPPGFDDGVPPPPPGFDDGVPLPPGMSMPPIDALIITKPEPSKKKYKPKERTKRLNWTKITYKDMSETSFWKNVDESTYEKEEIFDDIVKLFSTKTRAVAAVASDDFLSKKRGKEPMVLDPKTIQNLSIFIGTIKIPHDEIKKKILSFDKKLVTDTFAENLGKFLPPPDIRSMLLEHSSDFDDLPEAEQFVFKLSDIPELDTRLNFMLMMCKFTEQLNDIKPLIAYVVSACKEIRSCEKLHEILKIILLIGNFMNAESRNEGSFGYEIGFLTRLNDTKTQDNTMTFMNFLATIVERDHNSLIHFDKELASVQLAMKVNEETVVKSVNQIGKNISLIKAAIPKFESPYNSFDKFGGFLKTFYTEASDQYSVLQEMLEKMKKEFSETSEFFMASKLSIEEFFGIFTQFTTEFEKAVNDNKRKAQREERERLNKKRLEEEKLRKEERKNALIKAPLNLPSKATRPGVNKKENKEAVIDNLLQKLESGSAFKQHKEIHKKSRDPSKVDMLKDRKRTMNLQAKEMFRQMMKESENNNGNDVNLDL